ncbi:MAG: chorismate mutase [Bryobacteraceae bacterium]|jgi:chorismate mutase
MTEEEARPKLDELRTQIDELDRDIVKLLNDRMRVVEDIGRIKRLAGLPIYEPKRESEVFANVIASNGGPLPPDGLRRVFERIIDEARTVQRMRMQSDGGKP